MGFTLSVKNAPSPATQWLAICNNYLTGIPGMTVPLLLNQGWSYPDSAPGLNWLAVACFDVEGNMVQEFVVEAIIEDDKSYVFDFATGTLQEVTVTDLSNIIGFVMVLGVMAVIVIPMFKEKK